MLVPRIHFRTGGLDSSQHLPSVFIFRPRPRQGNPLRTAISPPSPSIHCPPGFCSQPLFPLSLLGRHVFKLVLKLKEQFHSQLPPLMPFRMQKACYTHPSPQPANQQPSSPSFSTQCPRLGNSKSLSLHLLVAALFTSHPINSCVSYLC